MSKKNKIKNEITTLKLQSKKHSKKNIEGK